MLFLKSFFSDIPLGQNLQFFLAAAVKIKINHYQNAQNYQSEKNRNQEAAVPKIIWGVKRGGFIVERLLTLIKLLLLLVKLQRQLIDWIGRHRGSVADAGGGW